MPEIIIQPDGSFLVPRGKTIDNHFFTELLENIVQQEDIDSLKDFFSVVENSEIIFGEPGLCG